MFTFFVYTFFLEKYLMERLCDDLIIHLAKFLTIEQVFNLINVSKSTFELLKGELLTNEANRPKTFNSLTGSTKFLWIINESRLLDPFLQQHLTKGRRLNGQYKYVNDPIIEPQCNANWFNWYYRNVTELNFSSFVDKKQITSPCLDVFKFKPCQVLSLNLNGCYHLTSDILKHVAYFLNQGLQCLEMSGTGIFERSLSYKHADTADFFNSFIGSASISNRPVILSLTKLNLSNCPGLNDINITHLLNACPRLEHLNLSNSQTQPFRLDWLPCCKVINYVDLTGHKYITQDYVRNVVNNCPSLEVLMIDANIINNPIF